ncbi:MAG: hypothetical protein H6711_17140 [Myxococcales bacterium]|nr:hypothetical protein [Myxococcales bacterium]
MVRRSLRLRFACEEAWERFSGDERRRHCERCAHDVFDLSTMTRSEATALFRERSPGLCVRYSHDGEGRILFRSERYPGRFVWQRFVVPTADEG